jgi:uncharacterized protein Veg
MVAKVGLLRELGTLGGRKKRKGNSMNIVEKYICMKIAQ